MKLGSSYRYVARTLSRYPLHDKVRFPLLLDVAVIEAVRYEGALFAYRGIV